MAFISKKYGTVQLKSVFTVQRFSGEHRPLLMHIQSCVDISHVRVGIACHDMFHAFFQRKIQYNLYHISLFFIKKIFHIIGQNCSL